MKMITDDMELLREYAQNKSETAFGALVTRHVNLVYSVALRQVRDPLLAEEVTQIVFIILARKAASLKPATILSGWLCRTARFVAARALTAQYRRQNREQEAFMRSQLNETADAWAQIEPLLNPAMAALGEKDHDAIALRFLEGRPFKDVGTALGTTEAGAKMRVNRALEKMRKFFLKRGVTLSISAFAVALSAHSLQAAPIGLATSVTVAAIHGTSVTTTTLTFINNTLKLMAWKKIKTTVVVSAIALLAIGTTTLVTHSRAISTGTGSLSTTTAPVSGMATPEAAFQSMINALGTGRLEKVLALCTPEQAARFKTKTAGHPDDEISRDFIAWAHNMATYKLGKKDIISDDEVRLLIIVQPYPGHPNVGNDLQVMQKMGDDWKYAGKWGVDIKDN